MELVNLWYGMFAFIFFIFIGVLLYSRESRYWYYFLTGAIFGFFFDIVSVTEGYYTYYPYFPTVFGVPLTVTVAEGCAIALTVFIYKELLPVLILWLSEKKRWARRR